MSSFPKKNIQKSSELSIFFIKSVMKSCDAWTLLEKYFYSSAGSERRKYIIIRTASPIFIDFIDFLLRQ